MLKISLVTLVALCAVLVACGCIGTSKPTGIGITTEDLVTLDYATASASDNILRGIDVLIYDANGNSIIASGTLHYKISSANLRDGEFVASTLLKETNVALKKEDFVPKQITTGETNNIGYTKTSTTDVQVVRVGSVVYDPGKIQNRYLIHPWPTLTKLGYVGDTAPLTHGGAVSCLYLLVQVDFMPDGSDSTIHAEKVLTA